MFIGLNFMKRFGFKLLLPAAALLCLASSCKDDDDSSTTKYLSGDGVTFSFKAYVRMKDQITFKPYGAYHPESGEQVYYTCSCSELSIKDTVYLVDGAKKEGDVTFGPYTMPDSTGMFTFTCAAGATGYYGFSSSADVTVVDPEIGVNLTGTGIDPSEVEYIVDSRNTVDIPVAEQVYCYTTIADLDWLRQNMGYYPVGEEKTFGSAYLGCEAVSYMLGRFYNFQEAKTACPTGWRLPTDEEVIAVAKTVTGKTVSVGETIEGAAGAFMADAYFFDEKMWEFWPQVPITNSTALGFIPSGYAQNNGNGVIFSGITSYGGFWTSTEKDGKALYRFMNENIPDILAAYADETTFMANVRCVRNTI